MAAHRGFIQWLQTRPVAFLTPRSRIDAMVARLLASALERGQSPHVVLDALARDTTISTPSQLQSLAWALEAGESLTEGVHRAPSALRPESQRAVQLGEATGTTVEQLRLTASLLERPPGQLFGYQPMLIPYVVAILLCVVKVTGFLSYWIAPKFKSIFRGFGFELPWATRAWLVFSDLFVNYFYLATLALGTLVAIWMEGGYRESRLWNVGRLDWWIPWQRRRRATPGLLRQAVIALDRQVPVVDLFRELPVTTTQTWLKNSLLQIRTRLESGLPLWDILQEDGYLTATEAGTLRSAAEVGNTRWVALGLADTLEQRIGFRHALRVELVTPVVTIALGFLVAFAAIAYFFPIVKLLNDLS